MTAGVKNSTLTRSESLDRIRQMAAEGMWQAEIARQFGASQQRVSELCRREGIVTAGRSKINIDQLRRMAAEGKTQTDIARQFGASPSHISRICKREGITTRKPARRSILSKVNIDQLRQMVAEGKTQTDIARQFGVNQQRISEICKREGITTRKPAKGGAK